MGEKVLLTRGPAAASTLMMTLLAVALSACEPAGSQPQDGPPPAQVSVVKVAPRDLPATFEYVGRTAGSREVEVRARVSGILLEHSFDEGGPVAAGQSLFTIDPAPFEAALARAKADVAAAAARLDQADRNAARFTPLHAADAVSQQEYDDALSAQAIAKADLQAARARLTEAQLALGYTRVESPVSGIAGRELRSDGNYVSGPDILLTTVTQVDPIYVLFGVSDDERLKLNNEVRAGRLRLPDNGAFTVTLTLADGSVYELPGRINFSDVRVSGVTGTSEARAELPNPDGTLRPGQFVRVKLSGAERPGAILVPQRAVLEGPQGKFVYVVSDKSAAEPHPVEVGDWQGDDWIIKSGVNAGDAVIVDGVLKIGPGAPVQVAEPATAGGEQTPAASAAHN